MRGFNIEAIFGGILALVVLGAAFYAITSTSFGSSRPIQTGKAPATSQPVDTVSANGSGPAIRASAAQDLVCECYDKAFDLAAKVGVLSPEYRTGFEQCRAQGGVDGGDAWTAGWNARLSSRPYESSCRSYQRRILNSR